MNTFMDNLKHTLNNEGAYTENGAAAYRTSGKELLDINFAVTSMRNESEAQIEKRFAKAFYEDNLLAIKWLFFAGDVRGGLGERRLFRVGMRFIAKHNPEIALKILSLVPEYTRWDNYLCLLDTDLRNDVCEILGRQLDEDILNKRAGENISLLAKWLPSPNTSSPQTKRYAKILIREFGLTEKQYRKFLSELRAYLRVVETKMSAKQWSEIDYSSVPSRANLIYNAAFLRNDEERRRTYLESLQKGETTINAGVLYPHDIVHKYAGGYGYTQGKLDTTLEELWKVLPDYVKDNSTTICVADGSGSMTSCVGNSRVSCLDVANALAIYFAERCSGEFKDKYITFSEHPQLVDFSKCNNLRDKINIALSHSEVANTNIKAVFALILKTAINTHMKQEDLPENILILSDMEFDMAQGYHHKINNTLFAEIAQEYQRCGYKLPRLVFWNICSRTNTVPVQENENGVALVSGFSPAIVKMVLSNSVDPWDCLLEQLNSERYAPVESALQNK